MTSPRIGSDYHRAPSLLEQRDTLTGSFAQYMPQMSASAEKLQRALLEADQPHQGDRFVFKACVVIAAVVAMLVVRGYV